MTEAAPDSVSQLKVGEAQGPADLDYAHKPSRSVRSRVVPQDAAGEAADGLSAHDRRRNFVLGVINGTMFRIGDIFIDTQTVLTWFLAQLGASNLLIGLVSPIRSGGSFLLQMLVSGYIERRPYKLPLYRDIAIFRCGVLVTFAVLVATVPLDSSWLLGLFFFLFVLFSLSAGLTTLPFMDVVGKVIPARRRGAFFSQRMFWGGIVALMGSSAISYLLTEPVGLRFPQNVALFFVMAAIFYWFTAWSWISVREPPSNVVTGAPAGVWPQLLAQFQRGFAIVKRDQIYRHYMLVRFVLTVAGWAGPFYVVYAERQLGFGVQFLGLYLGLRTVASLLSNLVWGRISDSRGNRIVIVGATAVGTLAPALALGVGLLSRATDGSSVWMSSLFGAVFLAAGTYSSGATTGIISYLLDIAPERDRPLYLAFTNTLFGLAQFTAMVGGLIVDWVGFEALLVISVVFYAAAFVVSLTLTEPRQ
jgi:MFS family permease